MQKGLKVSIGLLFLHVSKGVFVTKPRDESSQLKALRNDCHVFFMEVVSTLCFGYGIPEDRLIKMLIDTVFSEKGGAEVTTKELTYSEATTDSVPVIRSFLLKLLVDQR